MAATLTVPIRAFRFALTGLLLTAVHAAIAITYFKYVMADLAHANGVAFVAATMLSYIVNTTWSFSARIRGGTLLRFMVVSGVGFLLSVFVASFLQKLGWGYLLGIGAVVLTVTPVTFVLHNCWTYR